MTWTPDRVSQLTKLWGDGLSAAQIAKVMGCFKHCRDKGRSAVIGKANRIGLPPRVIKHAAGWNAPRKPKPSRAVEPWKPGDPKPGAHA